MRGISRFVAYTIIHIDENPADANLDFGSIRQI
jgi:hypothetical protein